MDNCRNQLPSEDIIMVNSFRATGGDRFRLPSSLRNSALCSPVESLTGSTHTAETDEEYYTLLSDLSRPHTACPPPLDSKLSGVGSWSGRSSVSSPNGSSRFGSSPTTPLGSNNNGWDLIYQAAGLAGGAGVSPAVINSSGFERQRSFRKMHTPSKSATQSFIHPNNLVQIEELFEQKRSGKVRILSSGDLAVQHGRAFLNGEFFGIIKNQYPHLVPTGTIGGGPGGGLISGGGAHGSGVCGTMNSQRVGTGVFLPRKYGDKNTLHHKSGYSSAYSTKKEINLVNTNKNIRAENPHNDTRADYDAAVLKQRAYMLTLQKTKRYPEVAINHELCLPQEWTY